MASKQRDIPWIDVIRFHKEIIQMDRDDFFSFSLDPNIEFDSERWTILHPFYLEDLAGPWEIKKESIVSPSLLQAISNKIIVEGYIAGPCGVISESNKKDTKKKLKPILYRSVRLEIDDNNINIVPEDGKWDLSPLQNKNDKIDIEIPIDTIVYEIIEKSNLEAIEKNASISEIIVAKLIEIIPEVKKMYSQVIVNTPTFKDIEYPWIFFTLPKSISLDAQRHLLADYIDLEKKIDDKNPNIGGLKIIEKPPIDIAGTKIDLLPIVPLNSSQTEAVSGILESKPVTVISGPPGCGKSQVVVSLLLNAWANNISVLFSSNTNASVNVVFDRLSKFECEYPIAIRSGSNKNNMEEAFRLILNNISSNKIKKYNVSIENKNELNELVSLKAEMQTFLDKKIPQEITQSLRSALTSYTTYVETDKEIESEKRKLVREIKLLGYEDVAPESFTETISSPLKSWLDNISYYKNLLENDFQEHHELETKLTSLITERNLLLQKIGIDPKSYTKFDWLFSEIGPEYFQNWTSKYQTTISKDVSEYLFPIEFKDEYLEWRNEKEAIEYVNKIEALLNEIRIGLVNYSTELNLIKETNEKYEIEKKALIEAGLSESKNYNYENLVQWKNDYYYLLSIPNKFYQFLNVRKAKKQLSITEDKIKDCYTKRVWSCFSEGDEKGRVILNENIDLIFHWMEIKKLVDEQILLKDEIEKNFRPLYTKSLNYIAFEDFQLINSDSWSKIIIKLESKKKIAVEAAEILEKKQRKEMFLSGFQKLLYEFQSILSTNPIVSTWLNEQKPYFSRSVTQLLSKPTIETNEQAQREFNSIQFEILISKWKDLIINEIKIQDYTKLIGDIPSEKYRIDEWWSKKPRCSIQKLDISSFPEKNDLLWKHLSKCNRIDNKWKKLYETSLSHKIKEKEDAYEWATENLKISVSKIPNSRKKLEIESIIQNILNEKSIVSWPLDELNSLFKEYDPIIIKNKINNLNIKISELAFTSAKESWEKNIVNEYKCLESIEKLYYHYKRYNNKIKGFSTENFKKALKAAPVWITTAKSSQSIPLEPELFDLLVIDEASQCTLTDVLPLIYRAKRIVVIGDQNQLPAIPNINIEREKFLAEKYKITKWLDLIGHNNNNIFDLGVKCTPKPRIDTLSLIEHYRSHPLIIGFSNHHIYHKSLLLRKEMTQKSMCSMASGIFGKNINGVCYQGNAGKSWVNYKEADAVCELIEDLKNDTNFNMMSIGVVSPFAAQISLLQKKINLLEFSSDITIGTAHTFQGDERDIIIFSPVISKGITEGAIKFANSPNLINVALTRAREALFVLGDFNYCKKSGGIVGNLIKYVETISLLRDTSFEELELFSWMVMEGWIPKTHVRVGNIEVDFILSNDTFGIKLVIEVDGRQHYYVEIENKKHLVYFDLNKQYIHLNNEKNNEKLYFHNIGDQSFVEINGQSYKLVQSNESIKRDDIRDEYLKGQGYKVLRITTKAIRETPANIIASIKKELEY